MAVKFPYKTSLFLGIIYAMEIIGIRDISQVSQAYIRKAADALACGGVIILPAGTIYGLSCVFDDRQGMEKIYELKKRSSAMPFILLFSNPGQLEGLAKRPGRKARRLMEYFWFSEKPRQLTMVLSKNPNLAAYVTAGRETIALRFAPPGFLRQLIDETGPLTSTSATVSGEKASPDHIEKIPESIKRGVDLIIESRQKLPGIESTIIDVTGNAPVLLREGNIDFGQILKVWKET